MKKLYTSKTFLKMAGGRMHNPHPTPLDPPLASMIMIGKESTIVFSAIDKLVAFF